MGVKISFVAIVILIIVGYFSAAAYFSQRLIEPVFNATTYNEEEITTRVVDVVFPATDGLPITGWYFPGTNGKAVLFVYGEKDENRSNVSYGTPEITKHLVKQGYTVLLFDLRGTAESTFARYSYGLDWKSDIVGAVKYLKAQGYEAQKVGIVANSYGAFAVINASSELTDLGGVVLDSPPINLEQPITFALENEYKAPQFIHPGIYLVSELLFGVKFRETNAIEKIRNLKDTPILFLHGANDTLIPASNSELLMESIDNGRRVLFPNAGHNGTYKSNSSLYLLEVEGFFETKLAN